MIMRFVFRYVVALACLAILTGAPPTPVRYAAAFALLYAVLPSRRKRRRV